MGQYETIAGGAGAGPTWQGQDCVHVHMTNVSLLVAVTLMPRPLSAMQRSLSECTQSSFIPSPNVKGQEVKVSSGVVTDAFARSSSLETLMLRSFLSAVQSHLMGCVVERMVRGDVTRGVDRWMMGELSSSI